MAQRRRYSTDGTAAYNVFSIYDTAARPLVRRTLLPEEPTRKKAEPVARPARRVGALYWLATASVLGLLLLTVFSFVALYDAKSESAELTSRADELVEENRALTAQFEQSIDLDELEAQAEKLGLHRARPDEIVTVDVPARDTTEVVAAQTGLFDEIAAFFDGLIQNVAAYFS